MRQRGFTLIEMLVVLAMLGVLASAARPLLELSVQRAREHELRQALRTLRERHVEASLQERFGGDGVRVWRALRALGALEQKQVADFCMLESREAKQLLHQMLRSG